MPRGAGIPGSKPWRSGPEHSRIPARRENTLSQEAAGLEGGICAQEKMLKVPLKSPTLTGWGAPANGWGAEEVLGKADGLPMCS